MANTQSSDFEVNVRRLRDTDPATRKAAIEWLARTKNPAAVKALMWSYQRDPELDLRRYAGEAIRYIRSQNAKPPEETPKKRTTHSLLAIRDAKRRQTQSARTVEIDGVPTEPLPDPTDTATPPDGVTDGARTTGVHAAQVRKVYSAEERKRATQVASQVIEGFEVYSYMDPTSEDYVSREDWEQARTLAVMAYDDHVKGKDIAGLRKLGMALDLDPNIQDEEVAEKAVKYLMDMTMSSAMGIMMDHDKRDTYIRNRIKQSRGLMVRQTWLDVALFGVATALVLCAGIFATVYVKAIRFGALTSSLLGSDAYRDTLEFEGVDIAATYNRIGELVPVSNTAGAMQVGITWGLIIAGALLVMNLVVHYATGSKRGNLTDTLSNLFALEAAVAAIGFALAALSFYLFFPVSYFQALRGTPIYIPIIAGLAFAGGVVFAFWRAATLARVSRETSLSRGYIGVGGGLVLAALIVVGAAFVI